MDNVSKDWFESYLHDRSHRVCINDTISDQNAVYHKASCGSGPGKLLQNSLFLVQDCIACMRTHYRTSLINIIYIIIHNADDTQIYMQCKDNVESINEAISKLEHCMREASD